MYALCLLFFVLIKCGLSSKDNSPSIDIQYSDDSHCTDVLLAELDSFQISFTVLLPHSSKEWGEGLHLYLEGATESFRYPVSLKRSYQNIEDIYCTCEVVKGHRYSPRCTIPAEVSYSKAKVFGHLRNRYGKDFFSNNVTVREIHSISAIRLHVNDKYIPRDTSQEPCTFYINREKPAIKLFCENAPRPCMVSIYHMGNDIAKGENCVRVNGSDVKSNSNYTFSVTVCGKNETNELYICQALFASGSSVAVNVFLITTVLLIAYIIK